MNDGRDTAPARRLSWNDPDVRSVVYQVVALTLVGLVGWFLVSNTLHNLSIRNIASGFGFTERESGFAIGESPIAFDPKTPMAAPSWSASSTRCVLRRWASYWRRSSAR